MTRYLVFAPFHTEETLLQIQFFKVNYGELARLFVSVPLPSDLFESLGWGRLMRESPLYIVATARSCKLKLYSVVL